MAHVAEILDDRATTFAGPLRRTPVDRMVGMGSSPGLPPRPPRSAGTSLVVDGGPTAI